MHGFAKPTRPAREAGLCGQPCDHPKFAAFLVRCRIDSMSVSPESFIAVKQHVAAAESKGSGTCT
ncbi:MAG: putative PEP-binding protein [Xanthobacteraceae bacterium]